MNNKEIVALLQPYVQKCKSLECDGTTRVLSWVLTENNIPHTVYSGSVDFDDETEAQEIPLHFWIVLDETNEIVDYKANMWIDSKYVTEGVFLPSLANRKLRVDEFTEVNVKQVYDGDVFNMDCSKKIVDILLLRATTGK